MSQPAGEPAPSGAALGHSRTSVWITDASLVFMALIWGANFIVVKYGTGQLAPIAFNGARLMLASVALLILAFALRRLRVSRRDLIALLLLGVLGNGVYQVLFVEGLALTRAGDAALVVAASPALVALIGRLLGVERIGLRGSVGIALSIVGIGFVVYSGTRVVVQGASVTGDLLVLVGSVAWALYTVLLTPYTRRLNDVTVSTYTMLGGTAALGLMAVPAVVRTPWAALSFTAWGAILSSGLGSLVLAYLFWYRGIRVIGPTRTAM
ncbi:MAG: DMT family transporter, partial [Gemmatimonadaceae bacterium]